MQRTTFAADGIIREMPDISGVSIDPEILLDCVNEWRMRNFEGAPPDPHEVMLRSTAQQEVVTMTNYVKFIRDEPERQAESIGAFNIRDMGNG